MAIFTGVLPGGWLAGGKKVNIGRIHWCAARWMAGRGEKVKIDRIHWCAAWCMAGRRGESKD